MPALLWPLYSVVRWVFERLRNVWWRATGTWHTLERISHGEDYDHSAHVLNVVGRFKLDGVASANFLEDFILVHDCFAHPACVFEDDVSLYKLTPTQLIFVQCPGKPAPWDVKAFPFSRIGQHKRAKSVIIVPKWSIVYLLEETGYAKSYKEQLVFLGMTGRCGSTLLCQIFQQTQNCVAYSEPAIQNDLNIFGINIESSNHDAMKYIKYSFMLLCKPVKGREMAAHVMKFQPNCLSFIQCLQGLFPDSTALFIYRDIRGVFRSFLNISSLFPIVVIFVALSLVSDKAYYNFHVSNGLRPPGKREYFTSLQKLLTQRESVISINFCLAVSDYLKAREQGCPIAGVRYEDLVAEPEATLRKVFQHSGIPLELVARGLPAMERDSQKGSPLDQQRLAGCKAAQLAHELNEKHRRDVKMLCQALSIPDMLENEILPGTLSTLGTYMI